MSGTCSRSQTSDRHFAETVLGQLPAPARVSVAPVSVSEGEVSSTLES